MHFKNRVYLGIECVAKDEKTLMQAVDGYLAQFNRCTSKTKNPIQLSSHLPFVIKHYYWNLNKSAATYCEIMPNQDTEGKWRYTKLQNCAWILFISIDHSGWERIGEMNEAKRQETQDFLNGLLTAIAFPTHLIMETDDPEFDRSEYEKINA